MLRKGQESSELLKSVMWKMPYSLKLYPIRNLLIPIKMISIKMLFTANQIKKDLYSKLKTKSSSLWENILCDTK